MGHQIPYSDTSAHFLHLPPPPESSNQVVTAAVCLLAGSLIFTPLTIVGDEDIVSMIADQFRSEGRYSMKKLLFLSLGSLLLLAGCFDIEVSMDLQKDLSGTAGLDFAIDMEPMAYFTAMMERAFSGEEGPPTAEELEAARQSLIEDMDMEAEIDQEEMRRDVENELPEGFKLLDAKVEYDELKMGFNLLIDFPHINRLHELELSEPGSRDPDQVDTAPSGQDFKALSEPFSGLHIVDEGDTYLLESDAPNPVEDMDKDEMQMPGMEEMLEKMFENLRVAVSIRVPGEIVEHNATRVEGRKLIWEFTVKNLQAGAGTDLDHIMVRFKK